MAGISNFFFFFWFGWTYLLIHVLFQKAGKEMELHCAFNFIIKCLNQKLKILIFKRQNVVGNYIGEIHAYFFFRVSVVLK